MLFKEMIAVYGENRTRNIWRLLQQVIHIVPIDFKGLNNFLCSVKGEEFLDELGNWTSQEALMWDQ
jgi:hypothetical protein